MWNKIVKAFSGNYTILLLCLFILFISRPYAYGVVYTEVWKTFLTFTLIIAIFNCIHQHIAKVIIYLLAIPVLVLSWLNLFFLTPTQYIITIVVTALYMAVCTGSIIYDVLLRARVTLETLRGVICAYFLVAFIFAYIFVTVEFIKSGSFSVDGTTISSPFLHPHFFSSMLYFSFVTLLTIGYGDIVPINEVGQTVVVLEGIIGQLYIAILVARIVSVYSFVSDKRLLRQVDKKLHSD